MFGLTFAPLTPDSHEGYDLQYTWDEETNRIMPSYSPAWVNWLKTRTMKERMGTGFEFVLPVEVNDKVDEAEVLQWAKDSDGNPMSVDVGNVSLDALKAKIADSGSA